MPAALRDRIAADVKTASGDQELIAITGKSAMVPRGYSSAEFTKILDHQRTHVAEMLATLGIGKK
jgi:tripartite-type tricarboxylate transporter receptor subunit TctC